VRFSVTHAIEKEALQEPKIYANQGFFLFNVYSKCEFNLIMRPDSAAGVYVGPKKT
jgi:hypothetical protein